MKRKAYSTRDPLSTEELERLTARDLQRLKLSEDERFRLREVNKARERERIERSARLKIEEEPIRTELRGAGWNVESVWDLVNTSEHYPNAIPILLKHLLLPYSDRTREGIARSLAVPEARYAWSTLVAEYVKAPTGWGVIAPGDTQEFRLGIKDGLACAVSVASTDETLEELIDIIKDRKHGESRVLLLSALRNSRKPLAKQAVEELADDPELKKEIASWRRR